MKILYIDCFSGISGDMFLGALIALGVSAEKIETAFQALPIPPVKIVVRKVSKQGIAATKATFEFDESREGSRTYRDIRELIEGSGLKVGIKRASLNTFDILAAAESKIHGIEKEGVHFHEVGGVDTICDVVGAMAALDYLGIDRVYTSPVPLGRGEIVCAHGILPNPAPAALEILTGFETFPLPYAIEFVTPTGAAILRSIAKPSYPVPPYKLLKVGYGAGDHEIEGRPNVLRVTMGETEGDVSTEQVIILETDIDDETAEVIAHVIGGLLERGALDVTSYPIIMKKGRIGTRITVISPLDIQETLASFLLSETTTLGVRMIPVSRKVLKRQSVVISTSLGEAAVKIADLKNEKKRVSPEYDSCARLAEIHKIPLRKVMDIVKREAETQLHPGDKRG